MIKNEQTQIFFGDPLYDSGSSGIVFYFSILFHILSFVNTNSVLLPGKGTFGFRTIPADAAWALPLQCADFLGFIGFFRVDRG